MDILYSLHKKWSNKIFDLTKPIEFRTKLPKDLKQNTKIYIYETSKNDGCQKVIGECRVDYIINVLSPEGKWPFVGCCPFLEYYFYNIKKDFETARVYENVRKRFENKSTNYKYGYVFQYAFSEENLKSIEETGSAIDTFTILNFNEVKKLLDDIDISDKHMKEVDNWLTSIGFYDEYDETNYRYGIVLIYVVKYNTPLSLDNFVNKDGQTVVRPPQSYMYVKIK